MNNAIEHYPKLKIIEENGNFSLSGEVDILHPIEKKCIDTFSVDISFPERFPRCFPRVVETSGKIERIPDRHIFVNDGFRLCFTVIVEELLKCRNGITTRFFLDNVLVPRLAEEYLVNNGGKYTHEFAHGNLGDFQFYFQEFKTENPNEVIRYLKMILQGGFPKHYALCSCGSGVKFKKCHRKNFEELKSIGDRFIIFEIEKLEKFIEAVKSKINK